MLPVIGLGDKLRITKKVDRYLKQSYVSQVGDILDEDLVLAHTPVSHGRLIRLPEGEDYTFLFYTQHELLQARGTIVEYCNQAGLDFMKVKYHDCQRIQRRLFFRQNCYFNFTFTQVPNPADEVLAENTPVNNGIVKNLSGGGMCFVSDVALTAGDQLICQLRLNDVSVSAKAIVRDTETPQNAGEKYKCRIEFIDIDVATQEHIIQHVFYLQREMIKNIKKRF